MRNVILIRHSAVTIEVGVSARAWQLSENGRCRTQKRTSQIADHHPTRIITSEENKAVETGQILAEALGIPWQTAVNLHEHERRTVPYFTSREEFETAVARFFARPDELVLGEETANQARNRFETAVHTLIVQHPADTLAIVTHGTVLTLFLAHHNNFSPFPFWQQLSLPDFFVSTFPSCLAFYA